MDLKNKLGDVERRHLDDVTAMQSHIQVQRNIELVLCAQIESLQEEQSTRHSLQESMKRRSVK
eukprot:10632826-Prorocentrum_lima.AAC.1